MCDGKGGKRGWLGEPPEKNVKGRFAAGVRQVFSPLGPRIDSRRPKIRDPRANETMKGLWLY